MCFWPCSFDERLALCAFRLVWMKRECLSDAFLRPEDYRHKVSENVTLKNREVLVLEVHHVGGLPSDLERFGRKRLEEIFGKEFCPGLSHLGSVAWSGAKSGYAAYPVGKFIDYFNASRQPENTLFFAGEHVAWRLATMEGALQSAVKAADQAAQKLGNSRKPSSTLSNTN